MLKEFILKLLEVINGKNVKVSNPNNANMGFYGAVIFIANNKLYYIRGKVGLGDDDSDYKSEIYSFKYENNEISNIEIWFKGNFIFIENLFHHVSEENVSNFTKVDNGVLDTMHMASLLQIWNNLSLLISYKNIEIFKENIL